MRITKEEIDEATREVLEHLTGGSFGMVNNLDYVRVYNRVYRDSGAMYSLSRKDFLFVLDIEKYRENAVRYFYDLDSIDRDKMLINLMNKYPDAIARKTLDQTVVYTERFMCSLGGYFICNPDIAGEIWDELRDCIPEEEEEKAILNYVMLSGDRFSVRQLNINNQDDLNIELNYEGLDNKLVVDILKEDRSSMMIFHGIPGTGKTSYIRKLISDNKDLRFYWLDAKLLQYSNNKIFIEFLMDHRNAIYVLEDCEDLLRDRGNFGNEFLSTVLNMADGMLGDSLNVKFICTFNADLDKIDEAVLRKGRLSLQHEFKKLSVEKVKALSEHLGIEIPEIKEMPLCDIYNFARENGAKKSPERRRVGFG